MLGRSSMHIYERLVTFPHIYHVQCMHGINFALDAIFKLGKGTQDVASFFLHSLRATFATDVHQEPNSTLTTHLMPIYFRDG